MKNLLNKDDLDPNDSDVKAEISKRLDIYQNKTLLEQYAIFMGLAQLLEFALKKILQDKFNYSDKTIEKMTLGMTKVNLAKEGIRADYINLLNDLIPYRNTLAHSFLADKAIIYSTKIQFSPRQNRDLYQGTYVLAHAIMAFDWLNHHDAWIV